ncbi:MAG: RNA methyltransferase [Phycisphaerales bacterium]|nr:RNA methyltransferase [Phycisphaerales bacterium]
MPIRISDITDPRLNDYRCLRERDLSGARRAEGVFVGETLPILQQMLAIPHLTKSVLTSERRAERVVELVKHSSSDAIPIFVVDDALMKATAGFDVHRGVLAIGLRVQLDGRSPSERPFASGRLLVALDGVGNMDNVGSIFRSAAAFGVDGVILSRHAHDPLYRKCVRVSMGHVLHIPFAWSDDLATTLGHMRSQRRDLRILAAVCDRTAQDISELDGRAAHTPPTLLVVGGEYDGISPTVRAISTACVRIPIASNVDSLNAAVATSVCLHRLSNLS